MKDAVVPLSDIARKLGINKSKLHYYVNLGLLEAEERFPESKIMLFNLRETSENLKRIDRLKKKGYSLKEIVVKVKK